MHKSQKAIIVKHAIFTIETSSLVLRLCSIGFLYHVKSGGKNIAPSGPRLQGVYMHGSTVSLELENRHSLQNQKKVQSSAAVSEDP